MTFIKLHLPHLNMNTTKPVPIKPLIGCNPVEQLARQVRLDGLYALDGRDSIDHEMHGLYTGLWVKYAGTPTTDKDSSK